MELTFKWGNKSFCQEIDYVKIPFRCSICHLYGHLRRTCPKKDLPVDEDFVDDSDYIENDMKTKI